MKAIRLLALLSVLAQSSFALQGEYHWTICGTSPAEVKRLLSATVKKSSRRTVYYLDTPALDLYRSGVVLRLRAEKGEPVEVTAKVRTSPKSVDPDYSNDPDFKCEEDYHGRNAAVNCSLSKEKLPPSELKRYLDGKVGAEALLTKKQHAYLVSLKASVPWRRLKAFGPVDNLKWKLESDPEGIDMELLTATSGAKLFELSSKSDSASRQEFTQLSAELQGKGIRLCPKQTGATAWTLGAD